MNNPTILACVAEYNYTAQRLAVGQGLVTRADNLNLTQVGQLGDQKNTTWAKGDAWDIANAEYLRQFKVARVALKKPGDRTKLALDGDRERGFAKWHEQVNLFYTHALDNPDILAALAEFNLTPQKLQAGQALLTAAAAAHAQQTNQMGVRQDATVERDKAVAEMEDWLRDYLAIAEVALEDHPQLLESLGIVVASANRSTSAPTEPEPPIDSEPPLPPAP